MLVPKYRAILNASSIDGLYRPFSSEIMVWREIFIYLEKCVDACEHVADTVESVVMKNS